MAEAPNPQAHPAEGWRYEFIANSNRDLMTLIDRAHVYVAVNDAYCRAVGRERTAIEGHTVADIWGEEAYREAIVQHLDQAFAGDEVRYESWFEAPGSGRGCFEVAYFPYRADGGDDVTHVAVVSRDVTRIKNTEQEASRTARRFRSLLDETAQALTSALEIRDPYTGGHQRRVTQLACAIGRELGLPGDRIDGLRLAGQLHDIGKIRIPAEILSKPTPLTDSEFALIRTHVDVGYDILAPIEFPWPVAEIVLQHHERLDGSGYPRGQEGEQLLIESRILSVADVMEAMASDRPYRPTKGTHKALGELSQFKGVLYDRKVVAACVRLFTRKGFHFR